MKTLFIYFSYTGNGELIANYLSDKGVETRKVTPKKGLPKSFFWSVMTGGFLAGINHKSKLVNFDTNIDTYERIIIGSPIWNGKFSCPINTVLHKLDLSKVKVTFLFYSGSGTGDKALKRINKEYPNAEVIFLKEPKKYQNELEKLIKLWK